MRNIVCFSGGKDSTALILWAKKNLKSFDTIFCDTGWEDPITYLYINYINVKLLDKKLITLKSEKYDGMVDLCLKKKRAPSAMARFCTEELKMKPTIQFVDDTKKRLCLSGHDIHLYYGIRAEESARRAAMDENVFDKNAMKAWLHRPLLSWTAEDVFDILKKHNIDPNPLYKAGMKRVGCMPCIMGNLKELRSICHYLPHAIDKVRDLENKLGRTFFVAKVIPEWARTKVDPKSGVKITFIDDIVRYVTNHEDQIEMFSEDYPSCFSYYNLCE